MKKSFLILLLAVVVVSTFVLTGCTTSYDKNILAIGEEGAFVYEDLTELQEDWTLTTSDDYTVSDAFDVVDDELTIDTSSTGWAQATQEIDILANAYYEVVYTYTCSSFTQYSTSKGAEFFFVSLLEDDDFNTDAAGDSRVYHNTASVNEKTGAYYFKTVNATKATLAINVGTEDHPVSVSDVTITSIKLLRVHKSEATSSDLSLFTFQSDTYGEVGDINIIYIVLGGIGVLVLGYAAYFMFQRNMAIELTEKGYKNKFLKTIRDSKWLGIVFVAGIAIIVRLAIDLIVTLIAGTKLYSNLGYEVEGQAAQALFMGNYGTAYLIESLSRYTTNLEYVYKVVETSPIYLYTLALCGLIGKGSGDPILATTFCIKLIASLADVGTVILIYLLTKKHVGNIGAVIMSVMYSLLPVTFGISAIWGLSESILAFFIMLTFYYMLQNKYYGVVASFMAAALSSWVAILVAPIVIFYTVLQFIKKKEMRIPIIIAVIAGFILFYVVNLPFTVNSIQKTPFICFSNYWDTLWTGLIYSINAFNFQAMLGNVATSVSTESLIVSIIFVLFLLTIAAIGYFKTKNRMDLLLLATGIINMMWMFGNNMGPASMYFSLALMLAYAIMNKEKRVYFCFVLYAAFMFVNVSFVELMNEYTLLVGTSITNETAIIYVFSSLNLILTLFYVYVVYDLVAIKKAKRIKPMPLSYIGWWKNLFLRIKKWYYKMRIKQVKQA